jgi:hypothetical protein
MSKHVRDRGLARRRVAKVTMTLAAWLVAFAVVMALLTLLGDELESLPLALRALVISGVLVSLMANLVMPILSVAIARWLTSRPIPALPPGEGSRACAHEGSAEKGRERSPLNDWPDQPREPRSRSSSRRTRCGTSSSTR